MFLHEHGQRLMLKVDGIEGSDALRAVGVVGVVSLVGVVGVVGVVPSDAQSGGHSRL